MTPIPAHIKQAIENKYPTGTDNALWLSTGTVFGYSLAEKEIERLTINNKGLHDKLQGWINVNIKHTEEIERLKRLLERQVTGSCSCDSCQESWDNFKTENNL